MLLRIAQQRLNVEDLTAVVRGLDKRIRRGIMAGAHYSAAKAAVISITRSMAKLMARHGVRVNCLAPAGVETDMLRQFDEEAQASLLAGIPIGRFGTAAEVADVVVWLTSPESDFITGQTLNVNGGAYLG